MDRMPLDVLLPIFKMYLEEPSTMPLPLMGVCKRWYNFIKSTPSLCFRVAISVKNENTIPFILSSSGLEKYLSRTDPSERDGAGYDDILLDIEVRSQLPSASEHNVSCNGPFMERFCQNGSCTYALNRRAQLDLLFGYLVGFRVNRWRSLIIEWDRLLSRNYAMITNDRDGFFSKCELCAPRLVHLELNGVSSNYMPKDSFTPNITSLSILNASLNESQQYSRLKSLWVGGDRPRWSLDSAVLHTVVELHIVFTQWKDSIICPKLPRLKIMKIYQRCPSPNIPHKVNPLNFNISGIEDRDQDETHRLKEVHLIGILAPTLLTLRNDTTITRAHKVVLHNTPKVSIPKVAVYGGPLEENIGSSSRKLYRDLRFIKRLRQSIELFKYSTPSSTKSSKRFRRVEAITPKTPPLPPPTPPSSPIGSLRSAASSASSLLSISSTDSFETSSPSSLLKVFIRGCTIDTEFMAVDESSVKCLEIALARVEATRLQFPPLLV